MKMMMMMINIYISTDEDINQNVYVIREVSFVHEDKTAIAH